MKQMSRVSRSRCAGIASAMVAMALYAACCGAAWGQTEPGTVPELPAQAGPPGPDLGPRSLPRQGYPNGLPPHPRSQDERFRNGQMPVTNLPPTPPTQAPPAPTPAAPAMPATVTATALPTTPPVSKPRYAQVSFHDGLLDVRADDSSLQQILRSIARRTGMKITGGVADQRVFGNYGPAPAPTVLATLLDGTGVNMLLRTTTDAVPEELVLTPQTGSATPPSLDLSVNDEEGNGDSSQSVRLAPAAVAAPAPVQSPAQVPVQSQPAISGPVSMPQPANNVNGSENNTSPTASTLPTTDSVPISSLPTPSTTPSSTGIVDAPNPPPPGSTTSQSPNGVATPETIYQQLMQLQQQKQNGTPAPPAGGTTPP